MTSFSLGFTIMNFIQGCLNFKIIYITFKFKEGVNMGADQSKSSASESLRKTRTYGKVRCHNPSCMDRLVPEPGDEQISCPHCGMTYRLIWVDSQLPRIRGPVWEVNRKLAQDMLAKKTKLSDATGK